jgi:hypothetical protein
MVLAFGHVQHLFQGQADRGSGSWPLLDCGLAMKENAMWSACRPMESACRRGPTSQPSSPATSPI